MATQTTTTNKRSLEQTQQQQRGVDQLVKGLSDTGITRTDSLTSSLRPFSTKDFLKRNLYADRMQNVHSIFAAGLERRRRAAQLGYGDDTSTAGAEPPVKRRRFQRRNSKTPAMLFKTMNFLPQDLFDDKPETPKETPVVPTVNIPAVKQDNDDDDDDWDGGLEIAEQLVKQLQQRRQSNASISSH